MKKANLFKTAALGLTMLGVSTLAFSKPKRQLSAETKNVIDAQLQKANISAHYLGVKVSRPGSKVFYEVDEADYEFSTLQNDGQTVYTRIAYCFLNEDGKDSLALGSFSFARAIITKNSKSSFSMNTPADGREEKAIILFENVPLENEEINSDLANRQLLYKVDFNQTYQNEAGEKVFPKRSVLKDAFCNIGERIKRSDFYKIISAFSNNYNDESRKFIDKEHAPRNIF